jgi:hypothetical protein
MLTVAQQHFRGNLGVILRPSPGLIDPESDEMLRLDRAKTFYVLALVSESTKSGEEGEPMWYE